MTKNLRIKILASLNMLFFVATMLVNTLGARGYINDSSQAEVSQMFPTMITPAGFSFSIWGVIYTALAIALGFILFKGQEALYQKQIEKISLLFCLSCLLNITWIIVFSYQIIWLSAIVILALFASVFVVVMGLASFYPRAENILTLAFGLYGGWLAIASVVNVSAFLVSIDFQFWGQEQIFYSVVLAIFLGAALFIVRIHQNSFFNLAIAWAFFGILHKISFESHGYLCSVLSLGFVLLIFSKQVLPIIILTYPIYR